jgi:hypothetical protein
MAMCTLDGTEYDEEGKGEKYFISASSFPYRVHINQTYIILPARTLKDYTLYFYTVPDMFRCILHHPEGSYVRTVGGTAEASHWLLRLFPSGLLRLFPSGLLRLFPSVLI